MSSALFRWLGEGRGKSGENYPKTPSSGCIAVWLVKWVVNKVGKSTNTRALKSIVSRVMIIQLVSRMRGLGSNPSRSGDIIISFFRHPQNHVTLLLIPLNARARASSETRMHLP